MKMAKERSAGVVVLKWSKSGWLYLTLVTTMTNKEGKRKLDFPKGHVEAGEEWIEAAVRETHEEAGISEDELHFTWGEAHKDCEKSDKVCRMFIASTSSRPEIRRNPESNRFEHIGWKWLKLDGDGEEELIHPYIRPAVEWARSIVTSRRIDLSHVNVPRQRSSSREGNENS